MSLDAMKQALEALEEAVFYTSSESWSPSMTRECEAAITALRAAIEHPRQWQGLTDEELREAYLAVSGNEWCLGGMSNAESFYEAIEAKLKEKNA